MYRNRSLRIFPLIIIGIVVIALIASVITIGRYIFKGGSSSQEEENQVTAQDELLTLSTSRSVRVTIRGPIVADEEFSTYRIEVSPKSRHYYTYSGYLDRIKQEKEYDNNMSAYEEFVYALDKADMTKAGKNDPSLDTDGLRGICSGGNLYEYEILNAGTPIYLAWTSSCKGSPGTFGASVKQVTDLFANQIPNDDLRELAISGLRY